MRQKYSFYILMIAILLLSMANSANAKTWYVDDDNPCPGTGTIDDPFCKIQLGIDAASDGDTVLVADGTYMGGGNKDLDFQSRAITVRSENGPDYSIIDCEGDGRGFVFHGGEGHGSVVSGFTIENSEAGYNAIVCWENSSPTITDCTIRGNGGSGIFSDDNSSPTIINCTITGNTTEYSGAIHGAENSFPTIIDCTIAGNIGGGINLYNSSATITGCTITGNSSSGITCGWASPTITNCTIAGNTAEYGGGIHYSGNSSATITNCTITGNTAEYGGGIYCESYPSAPIVTNSIFWEDTPDEIYVVWAAPTVTYSDIQGGFPGEGNIDADPLFVGGGDYHLKASSPCIDAGTNDAPELPTIDFEGDPRIVDGDIDGTATVDMGADEYASRIVKLRRRRCEPGEKIRIIGYGFGETQGDSLVHIGKRTFDSSSPRIKLWSDTKIRIKVPNYRCEWFNGQDYRRRKVWVTVDGVDSNKKRLRVMKPASCP